MKKIILIIYITIDLLSAQVPDSINSTVLKKERSIKKSDKRINFIVVPAYSDRSNDYAFKFDYVWASFKAFISGGKTKLIEVENGHPQEVIDEMISILKHKNAKIGSILNDHHGRLSSGIFTFIGIELKKGDVDQKGNASVFNQKIKSLEALSPFIDRQTKILLGNCSVGQEIFQPLLMNLSVTMNDATLYAHMTYCMSPALFWGGGFENLTAQKLDYGAYTIGENVEAYEAIGTWKKIQGNSMNYVGMMRMDYWGNIYESKKYFYDDGDRKDRLLKLINQLKSK